MQLITRYSFELGINRLVGKTVVVEYPQTIADFSDWCIVANV